MKNINKNKIMLEVRFSETEMRELVNLLSFTKMFSENVIQQYKFDGSNDSLVAKCAFDATGHLYQSSGVLLSLLKDAKIITDKEL